jgi:enterochelin esterase family protein
MVAVLVGPASVSAQPAPQPVIASPVVHDDGRVSIAFRAPNAREVVLAVNSQPNLPMTKDADGIWRATTPPLLPDVYGYRVMVDGVPYLDPLNTDIVPNLLNPQSKFHLPGATPQPWDVTDVPRGTVHRHFYRSAIVGDDRDYYVYTPPGYDRAAARPYPVLFLLHGFSDDARGWTSVGHAHVILDNLIAQGRVTPMLVVMPLGYGDLSVVSREGAARRDPAVRMRSFERFRASVLDELLPAVERDYHVSRERTQRAIAGLSMGGAQSLYIGLNRLDRFGAIGAFSAGGFGNAPDLDAVFADMPADPALRPSVLWVACGVDDSLLPGNRAMRDWLTARALPVTYKETPGAHTWFVWRRYLTEFLPLLFRR